MYSNTFTDQESFLNPGIFIMLIAVLLAGWQGSVWASHPSGEPTTHSAPPGNSPPQPVLPLPGINASADEVVTALEQALLHVMQMQDADTAARAAVLQPILHRTFDFQRMSRFIFGPRWNDFSAAQQNEFMRALLQLSCASYAANFDNYNQERFTAADVAETRPDPNGDRVRINRHLITNKQSIVFNYALTRTDKGWQIANILAKGVSDLALKRSQYSKLYDNGGVAAVLDHIASQTERLYTS